MQAVIVFVIFGIQADVATERADFAFVQVVLPEIAFVLFLWCPTKGGRC
jgi:hypothetical protein